MKNCTCKKWKNIVGEWKENPDPYSSIGASVPMYFGRVIDYCPWCGKKLQQGNPAQEDSLYFCPECGATLHDGECLFCGGSLGESI